jgi:hypothetical protein
MRRSPFLKLFVGLVALSCGSVLYAGYADFPTLKQARFEAKDLERGTILTTRNDVEVSLEGELRSDWIAYDKMHTLRPSNDDQLSGFRNKSCIDFMATYGKKTYGRSAADGFVRLTNYGYWYDESHYTPFSDDTKAINMLTYMEELWINLHLGTFFEAYDNWFSYKDHPVSVKMGYFPYMLGRGISFGDFPIHVPYLGWDSLKYDDARFNHPGILIHGYINKNISYDLYYSKQSENSILLSKTWETINENRTDGRRKWRGIAKDRDLWAARMDFRHQKSWGDLHVQPYMMYVDASELKIEVQGDSAARLGTVGLMCEFKRGQFSMNAEVAGQFGHQNVHAIDRNEEVEEKDTEMGLSTYRYTHIFGGSETGEVRVASSNTATPANVNIVQNRGGWDATTKQWIPAVTKNGDLLYESDGTTALASYRFAPGAGGGDEIQPWTNIYNSNVTGNKRFRDGYRIDYRGFMGVIDMKYEFEDVPLSVAVAGAYISGDRYPYNEEKDKRYRGFIPYGDYNYIGKYVYSQVLLEERKLPRPVDISYRFQYAFNNIEDMSNLAYLGTGVEWKPFKDKNKLMLRSNILWFWETIDLKVWNKEQELPYKEGTNDTQVFEGSVSWPKAAGFCPAEFGECGNVWVSSNTKYLGEGNFIKGWKTKDDASRVLGTEINFEVQYRPIKNCIVLGQLGCFIPGQLYKDLKGQPNVNTINGPQAAVGNFGLGNDPVWRLACSVDYRF